jgi:hypothetical protein
LLEKGVHAGGRQLFRVHPERPDLLDLVDLHPVGKFHREHPGRGELPIDFGNRDLRILLENETETLGVVAFHREVELAHRPIGELFHDSRRLIDPQFGDKAFRQSGQVIENVHILLDGLPDAGALDLHGDLGPVFQPRPVDLGQGRGGHRLVLERAEHVLGKTAQFVLDDPSDRVVGKRLNVAVQFGEFRRHVFSDQIRPEAEDPDPA